MACRLGMRIAGFGIARDGIVKDGHAMAGAIIGIMTEVWCFGLSGWPWFLADSSIVWHRLQATGRSP
jgi:hypothetical protein